MLFRSGKLGLDDCLARELGFSMKKGIGHKVEDYTFDEVAKYSYLDAKYTFLLWKTIAPKITEAEVDKVMALEMDVLRVLCDMKITGANIDMEQLKILGAKLEQDLEDVKAKIYSIAGQVFNINSTSEKQHLLYGPKEEGGRGLKPKMLTGKGATKENPVYTDYSVSSEALEEFREIGRAHV